MQRPIPPDRKKKPFGAHSFLKLAEKRLSLLEAFLERDRTRTIAEMVTKTENRRLFLSLKSSSNIEASLIYTLESHEVTRQYFDEFVDIDWTRSDQWRILKNKGFNSQGKLSEFAEKHGFDLPILRSVITVTMKEKIIENELQIPALTGAFLPIRERLKEINFEQLDVLCHLLRCSPRLLHFQRYSLKMVMMRENYKILIDAKWPRFQNQEMVVGETVTAMRDE
ncbi:hypothetical protein BGW36DRAFT_347844 [Talaromyces proteolyticus]|uniref:Uncharacterized protein n=1 Tax=Talaromyces proteolyticus TaxID=1131652 RepID=A0AAD4KHF9_9EURO|nr:uncharacterized protein BGW36DRAFT_347844 [Talaromyces proteolyticus]KAH8691861.1 hypothetical protein BGW36DRAFT_347844 [Talaromyces proteolyticus]